MLTSLKLKSPCQPASLTLSFIYPMETFKWHLELQSKTDFFFLLPQACSTSQVMIPPFKNWDQKCRHDSWFLIFLIWIHSNSVTSDSIHFSVSTAVFVLYATNTPCLDYYTILLTGFLISAFSPNSFFTWSSEWHLKHESTHVPPLLKALQRFSFDWSPVSIGCPSRPCPIWRLANFAPKSHASFTTLFSSSVVQIFFVPQDLWIGCFLFLECSLPGLWCSINVNWTNKNSRSLCLHD